MVNTYNSFHHRGTRDAYSFVELRDEIYGLLATEQQHEGDAKSRNIIKRTCSGLPLNPYVNILCCNKAIYEEAAAIFYRRNRVVVHLGFQFDIGPAFAAGPEELELRQLKATSVRRGYGVPGWTIGEIFSFVPHSSSNNFWESSNDALMAKMRRVDFEIHGSQYMLDRLAHNPLQSDWPVRVASGFGRYLLSQFQDNSCLRHVRIDFMQDSFLLGTTATTATTAVELLTDWLLELLKELSVLKHVKFEVSGLTANQIAYIKEFEE